MGRARKLTIKQKAFADHYIKSGNATESAVLAGYSKKYANTNASKLLQNTTIAAYIDKRLKEIGSARTADLKEVMEYLTSVMRGESKSEVVVVEGTGEGKSQARNIHKRPDEKERLDAAKQLMKRFEAAGVGEEIEDLSEIEADIYGN